MPDDFYYWIRLIMLNDDQIMAKWKISPIQQTIHYEGKVLENEMLISQTTIIPNCTLELVVTGEQDDLMNGMFSFDLIQNEMICY